MAQYKCLPMYEYIRPGIYVLFNQNGDFLTNEPKVIEALDGAAPFVERVDEPEETPVPKAPAAPRATKPKE